MLHTALADTLNSVCFTSVRTISAVRLRRAILRLPGGLLLCDVLGVGVGEAGVSFTEMSTTLGVSSKEMSTTVVSVTEVSTTVASVADADAAAFQRSVGDVDVESIYLSIGPAMAIGLSTVSTAVCEGVRMCVCQYECV